jgi:molybdopterin converting factor small subunit
MMKITVKLFASLGAYAPDKKSARPFPFEIEEGATLKKLIQKLDIPEEIVKLKFVNGRTRNFDYPLKTGDEVGFFPPIGGG